MDALDLTIFVSLCLACLAVLSFLRLQRDRTLEHSDRLSLLPLDEAPPNNPPAERNNETEEA